MRPTKQTKQSYSDMKQRCLNPSNQQYKNYGARGIGICLRWLESFDNFFSDMGNKPDGLTLDRRDNELGYSADNCRWATPREQRLNQRTCTYLEYQGERLTVRDWAARIGRHETTLHSRIKAGWPIDHVLSGKSFGRYERAAMTKGAKP